MICKYILFRYMIFWYGVYVGCSGDRATFEQQLHQKLFLSYNADVHPGSENSTTVIVKFDVQVMRILEINERDQTIEVYVWINQYWNNLQLRWDPTKHGNVSSIYAHAPNVWTPDIVLYNNIDDQSHELSQGGVKGLKNKVRLDYNGDHTWMNQVVIKSICHIDVSYFPFDDQCCFLKFGSWAFDSSRIDMIATPSKYGEINEYYVPNGEWQMLSIKAERHSRKYQCCKNPFVDVTVNLKIRRFALNYALNLIVPCALLSSLVVLGYILPPESGERMGLIVALLLSVTVFQQLTNQIMPSYDFPYLAQYYWATIIQTGMSLVVTTIILNCYHRHHRKMHWLLRKVLLNWIGPVIFCSRKKTDNNDSLSEDILLDSLGSRQESTCNCNNTDRQSTKDLLTPVEGQSPLVGRKLPKPQKKNQVLEYALIGSMGAAFQHIGKEERRKNELEQRRKDWLKAARISDRLFSVLSLLTFAITAAAIFFRAPRFWDDSPGECPVPMKN